jgi:hypothetical protein
MDPENVAAFGVRQPSCRFYGVNQIANRIPTQPRHSERTPRSERLCLFPRLSRKPSLFLQTNNEPSRVQQGLPFLF